MTPGGLALVRLVASSDATGEKAFGDPPEEALRVITPTTPPPSTTGTRRTR
jgi:hypothetical protein